MRILIIGANGQLGWELCRRGKNRGFEIIPLDLPEFDITDHAVVKKTVTHAGASLAINAAAYTAVDKAESEPVLAFAVNRDGPTYLASSCANVEIPLIHMSTDYVFNGKKVGPYLETDPISPIGIYGRSKAAGEAEVRSRLPEHIIVRTSWLYGVHGNNFVKTMLRVGCESEIVRVVDDQYGCPTYAADLAEAILEIAVWIRDERQVHWGIYHYCGRGIISWYGFAKAIFHLAREHDSIILKKVVPITTEEYPTPAKRPANSALDCSLFSETFGISPPPWRKNLALMVKKTLSRHKTGEPKEVQKIDLGSSKLTRL